MADSELTVTATFEASGVEPAEVDRAITDAVEELALVKDTTIKLNYVLRYRGVIQR